MTFLYSLSYLWAKLKLSEMKDKYDKNSPKFSKIKKEQRVKWMTVDERWRWIDHITYTRRWRLKTYYNGLKRWRWKDYITID